MTTAIRASNSRIWHLTDQIVTYARDEGAIKTRCNRGLTIPVSDRNGYQFDQMHTWPINQDPKQAWIICPKCGTISDFMAASEQRWNEEKKRQQIQTEARQKAQAQAGEKASVLTDIWQQTLDSLSAVGWQIQKPQYRRYRATMQVNGFTFEMEFVRPDAAFGVNTATGEVTMSRYHLIFSDDPHRYPFYFLEVAMDIGIRHNTPFTVEMIEPSMVVCYWQPGMSEVAYNEYYKRWYEQQQVGLQEVMR